MSLILTTGTSHWRTVIISATTAGTFLDFGNEPTTNCYPDFEDFKNYVERLEYYPRSIRALQGRERVMRLPKLNQVDDRRQRLAALPRSNCS